MAKKPDPIVFLPSAPASAGRRSMAVLPRISSTTPRVTTPADRVRFDASAYRGAAGVAGIPPLVRAVQPNIYAQNAAQMRAAGATGIGQRNRPMVTGPNNVLGNVISNNIMNQLRAEEAFGAPTTIPAHLIPSSMRGRVTPAAPTTPTPTPPRGSSGGSSGGGGAIGGIAAAAAAGSPMAQSLLDQLRAGYGAQRSAIDTQMQAAIAAQAARRGSAESAQRAAADQLARILSDLSAGAVAAGQRVGEVYGGAGQQLGSLMQDYERMMAERGEAAGRTLAAFGADASMAQPGGMSAADYLAAERAALGRMGATEQAYWAGRPQAYQGLASDINTQRALQYEQLMNEIAQGEAAARGQAEADRARISTAEAQAILDAQMQAWQMQQDAALRAGQSGGGGGGGGGDNFSFLPIPPVFGG